MKYILIIWPTLNDILVGYYDAVVTTFTDFAETTSYGMLLFYAVVAFVLLRFGYATSLAQSQNSKKENLVELILPKSYYFSSSTKRDIELIILSIAVMVPIGVLFYDFSDENAKISVSKIICEFFKVENKYKLDGFALIAANVLYSIVWVAAYDFGSFFGHWCQHKNKYLWEFHKGHHSANVMTPLTAYRAHLTGFLNGFLGGLCAGVVTGIFTICFGADAHVYDVAIVYITAISALQHSPIWWSFGKYEKWFYSPAMHQLHHSINPKHYDKNFSVVFSFWDRIFGSFLKSDRLPETNFSVGVDDNFDWNKSSFGRVAMQPFKMCYLLWTSKDNNSSTSTKKDYERRAS